MKRQTNIKGYTRKVNGKTVHVKPHSRMSGKDGANKAAGAGAELRSRAASAGSSELESLSRMFRLGANGEVEELPYDRSEINYVGADAAEVGINPKVKPGEMSASRKKWLADLDRKLTPAEKAKYGKSADEKPMSRKEFSESLARAQAMRKGGKVATPTEAPAKKKRGGLSSLLEEFKGYYKQYKK